ncbi:hepatic triacylglycerol lipase-like [Engraulis encrasicolus]|uniref:hepatic triacylglycerol lipase-like n=1 Tax=Engraulis encrasicolus TaxID=184585 RepID=UPI002FD51569
MEDWMIRLGSALKAHLGRVNVLVCDWQPLAQRFYPIAAQNARQVGQELALYLDWLQRVARIPMQRTHLIGYSLGAHVAGFAGRFFSGAKRLGRITGLDPAGPMFEGMPAADRLSPDDAMFVDAIHTFTKKHMGLSVGIKQAVAQQDFYPNGGTLQPGCLLSNVGEHISQHGLRGVSQAIKCAHERSIDLFIDSLLHQDQPITAFRCRDDDAFSQGLCLDCKKGRCNMLGYGSKTLAYKPSSYGSNVLAYGTDKLGYGSKEGSGGASKKFYLRTRSQMPYRVHHYQLRVQLLDQEPQSWASASVSLIGQQGESEEMPLQLPEELSGNETLSFLVTLERDIGHLKALRLRWGQQGVLADMWHKMRAIVPWGSVDEGPVLSVGKVRIKTGETQQKMWFCSAHGRLTQLRLWEDYMFHKCHSSQQRSRTTLDTAANGRAKL